MASGDLSYIKGDTHHLSEVRLVLLGCRNSGKSSAGNIILGQKVFDLQESEQCLTRHGEVAGRKITVVEAPGWCSDRPVEDSTELLKEEIICSVSMCPPGPHAVLVVVNGDRMFTEKGREILAGYLNLLGDKVWSHAVVLFTFGDTTIETEGKALQRLVEKCGNRYHVLKNEMDDSQVMDLLEKIEKVAAENGGRHLETDTKTLPKVEERRREEGEKLSERRMNGMKYSPYFMNGCICFFKFLQVFWFSFEQELLPVWSFTLWPRFRMGFRHVLQFLPSSQKHAEDFRGDSEGTQATSSLYLHAEHVSVDTEVFTPELVKTSPENRNGDEYRFLCPGSGRFKCKLTDLVFEMEGKGVVLYRIVSWDGRVLDGISEMEPAGPLYSVHCPGGLIRHLHLPHCEICLDVVKLTAADVTGGNVDIIQAPKVTDTHVIVDSQRISLVGLLKPLLFQEYPIRARVVLFWDETGKHRMSKIHIHLLPGNMPAEEVQKQHNYDMCIETSSKCQLTPGNIYKPCCKTTECDYVYQPEDNILDRKYGPNYHPTFEVLFNTEVDRFTLSLLDEKDQEVWRPHEVLLTGTETPKMDATGKTGADVDVDDHGELLIQLASSLKESGDHLKECNPVTQFFNGFLQSHPTYQKQPAEDVELFIPDLVETCAEDRNRDEYRFVCPRAGQFKCKLTDLVYEMEGKGVVRYRIVSWDSRVLDGITQKEPAGPLYSIECGEGSVARLHLPHCETRTDVVELTVAHVTGGNVEIIPPLKVTDTHVIIAIRGLSLFSLFKALFFQSYPVRAQVLLFYKKLAGKHRMSKLHIHLLPGNVPVREVQKQRECNMYIETSSKCQLTPGRTYRPCCKTTDRDYAPQPKDEKFDFEYGPNYHPTFEVVFRSEVDEVTLSLLAENGREVWTPRLVLLTGTEETSIKTNPQTGADFVDKHRETLIQNVPSVMEIADGLEGRKIITNEMYRKIQAAATPQGQMRELLKHLGGRAAKAEFYQILCEKQPCLVEELESRAE